MLCAKKTKKGTDAVSMSFPAQHSVPPTLIKVVLMKISAAVAQGGCWSCSGERELARGSLGWPESRQIELELQTSKCPFAQSYPSDLVKERRAEGRTEPLQLQSDIKVFQKHIFTFCSESV